MKVAGNSFQLGQLGIQRGLRQLREAASTIARNDSGAIETNNALISLIESRQQVEASVRVMERTNRALDLLINLTS
ncbi:MAG: hypothetical protein AAF358_01840 [Pseudomonadota bacterium]